MRLDFLLEASDMLRDLSSLQAGKGRRNLRMASGIKKNHLALSYHIQTSVSC